MNGVKQLNKNLKMNVVNYKKYLHWYKKKQEKFGKGSGRSAKKSQALCAERQHEKMVH